MESIISVCQKAAFLTYVACIGRLNTFFPFSNVYNQVMTKTWCEHSPTIGLTCKATSTLPSGFSTYLFRSRNRKPIRSITDTHCALRTPLTLAALLFPLKWRKPLTEPLNGGRTLVWTLISLLLTSKAMWIYSYFESVKSLKKEEFHKTGAAQEKFYTLTVPSTTRAAKPLCTVTRVDETTQLYFKKNRSPLSKYMCGAPFLYDLWVLWCSRELGNKRWVLSETSRARNVVFIYCSWLVNHSKSNLCRTQRILHNVGRKSSLVEGQLYFWCLLCCPSIPIASKR